MKTIIVKWVRGGMYGTFMMVISSNHDRFREGTRFHFGFFSIATEQGYTIISLPLDPDEKNKGEG